MQWGGGVGWGGSLSAELSTLFENSHCSCVLSDEAQARAVHVGDCK